MRDSSTSQLTYLLGDQLGSTSVSVSASGGTPVVQRYLPYGASRVTSGTPATDRGWIGQTQDSTTGLQYLNARYYDPLMGRFAATDPIVDTRRPPSLDRYGYGYDNPVTLSDPTGLWVPVGAGNDPDRIGSYDARRRPQKSRATGSETRLRLRSDRYQYHEKRGLWATYQGSPADDPVTGYQMALAMFRNNAPWDILRPNHVDARGAFASCQIGLEGCQYRKVLITWDDIRAAMASDAAERNSLITAPSDSQILRAISNGSGLAALFFAPTPLAPASPYLAGLSGLTAVGAEATDPAPCRGHRVAAEGIWQAVTLGIGGMFDYGGHGILSATTDVGGMAFSPAGSVTC